MKTCHKLAFINDTFCKSTLTHAGLLLQCGDTISMPSIVCSLLVLHLLTSAAAWSSYDPLFLNQIFLLFFTLNFFLHKSFLLSTDFLPVNWSHGSSPVNVAAPVLHTLALLRHTLFLHSICTAHRYCTDIYYVFSVDQLLSPDFGFLELRFWALCLYVQSFLKDKHIMMNSNVKKRPKWTCI